MDADALLFFAGRPRALALYEALLARLTALSGAPEAVVRRTQISLRDRRLFACVSLPRRRADTGLVLTLGLARRLESPRVFAAAEARPGRWTHHTLVSAPEELDEELLSWIGEARAFAAAKR